MVEITQVGGPEELPVEFKSLTDTLADRVRRSVCSRQEAESYVSAAEAAFAKLRDPEAMTADQQIRANALGAAVVLAAGQTPPDENALEKFWAVVDDFETYIRNGK